MDAFITFYRRKGGTLEVNNGFSFVRHLVDGVDVFVSHEDKAEDIQEKLRKVGADRVFCTLTFGNEFRLVKPIVDEKWVLGGPFVGFFGQETRRELSSTVVDQPFEEYLGLPLSSTFTPYFSPLVKEFVPRYLMYVVSAGRGCYWNRCNFCYYRCFDAVHYVRGGLKETLERQETYRGVFSYLHLGVSTISVPMLRDFLAVKLPRNVNVKTYCRADKAIVDAVRDSERNSCSKRTFSVGMESLSQSVTDLLNKNQTRENVIQLTDAVLSRGGKVLLGMMEQFPFLTEEMVRESADTIVKLRQVVARYPSGRVWFWNNGPVCWNDLDQAVGVDEYTVSSVTPDFKLYRPVIKNEGVLRHNREMASLLLASGIKVRGHKFVSDLK